MRNRLLCSFFTVSVGVWTVAPAHAQSAPTPSTSGDSSGAPSTSAAEAASIPAAPPAATEAKGLLPIPDYSGDFWTRRALTGDWGGSRTELANKGVQVDLRWNQQVQSVVSGGRDNGTAYGGNGDLLVLFDLMRMGVLPGALLKFRAESRYGDSVNADAGPLLPVNTDAFFPLTDTLDEPIPFTITNLAYIQYFSEQFAVSLGKIDTLDGDPNEFASGRGESQFMNANFSFNPSLALRLPYSTLGAGVVWLPVKGLEVTSVIMNTADSSTTTGFDKFGDGLTWTSEVHWQYRLGAGGDGAGGLPGGMNGGFLYSFDQDFTKLGGRLVFAPGQGLSLQTEDDTWAVYWSGWQYLWAAERDGGGGGGGGGGAINLTDGRPDLKGIGLFARLGTADGDTNPVEWAGSIGLGGRGLIPTRDDDTLGVGYFYASFRTDRLISAGVVRDHGQGFEAFYNIAITPAAHLTLDVQAVEGSIEGVDSALVLGMRLGLSF